MVTTPTTPQGPFTEDDGADALAGGVGPQIAQNVITAGQQNNGSPRDWAENMVSGVTAALAGFGAAGKVPAGAGALYGVGAAARQGQARQDQQQQQKIENQRQQHAQMTADQVAQAQVAHLNAVRYQMERGWRNADRDTQDKITASEIASQPKDVPPITNGTNLTAYQMSQMLKPGPNGKSEVNGHEVAPWRNGMQEMIGTDGKPQLDKDGLPMREPVWNLYPANATTTPDDTNAKFIADNTGYHPQAGTEMPMVTYQTLMHNAQENFRTKLDIDTKQALYRKDSADADEAEGEVKNADDTKAAISQVSKIMAPYRAQANGVDGKAFEMLLAHGNPTEQGIVNHAYGPKVVEDAIKDYRDQVIKQNEIDQKKKETSDYTGDPDAATPQQYLASLEPNQRETVRMIGEGRVPLNSPTYLLARKPEIMDAVARAYPGFDASKVKSYQDTYHDFTAGKTSIALNAGGTALQHLAELKAINDANPEQVRIPGTEPNQAYQNKVDTVAAELARFYGTDTVSGIASIKATLDPTNPFASRDTAITTQAHSMGDKLDSFEQTWRSAAPSAAYQAPMPGISDAAKVARAALTGSLTATGPNGQKLILRSGKWVPVQAQ